MKTELFIAFRHLKERKFQTIMATLGVLISLVIFIVSLSISNGLRDNMLNSILSLTSHVSVIYPINEQEEGEYTKDIEKIKNIKDVVSIIPVINAKGIIKYRSNIDAFLIKAMDSNDVKLKEGNYPNSLDEILIGNEYADLYNIQINDKLKVVFENNKEVTLKVSGIFKTGYYDYDSQVAIIPLQLAQIMLEVGYKISELSINVKNPTIKSSINEVKNNLEILKKPITTWFERNQSILSAIEFENFVLTSILIFLLIISSFVISVILNMIIREKIPDIGILKSFGYTNKNILTIFLIEALIIGGLGIILSIIIFPIIIKILQFLFVKFITSTYYIDTLPVTISFSQILTIYSFTFFVILLASVRPIKKASSMKPTEAIKYN